jgi:hypothetical protein
VPPSLRLQRAAALATLLALGNACSSPDPPVADAGPDGCTLGFLGDPAGAPEMELVALGPDGKVETIADGASVPLMFPPQGGRVVFAGVRVRNVNACQARLAGALRDLSTQAVRIDNRTVNLTPESGGWGGSVGTDISTFANIAACPNQWASQDIYDHEFELVVTLTDKDKRKVTRTVRVTPRCSEPGREAECLCMCRLGYKLGEPCAPADGGAGGGGAGGSGGAGGAPNDGGAGGSP